MQQNYMSRIFTFLMALIVTISFSSIVQADDHETNQNIVEVASNTGSHEQLVAALQHAELTATLEGDGPFTVFAPTDQAFTDAGIDLATFDTDEENNTLSDILRYHVVTGKVMSTDLSDGTSADALNQDKLSISVGSNEIKINDALVTSRDVESSNGIIHVIDKLLLPPLDVYVSDGTMSEPYFEFFQDPNGVNPVTELDISKAYKFQRLNNPSTHPFYVGDSGYKTQSTDKVFITGDGSNTAGISDDESFTVFFKEGFTIDDRLDYFCTVHQDMIAQFKLVAPATLDDIPAVANSTGAHNSLATALIKTNLIEVLQGDGPFTVFAPTDDAFTAAEINLDDYDTDEEKAVLRDLLLYHVISGSVINAADITDGMTAVTANDDAISFTVSEDGVKIGEANVSDADIAASNGVIHVIDKILTPPVDVAPADPCDVTIGIDSSGYAFDQVDVKVNVGDTVCWKWTNSAMAHNVAQTTGISSNEILAGGVYSGAAAATVDFNHTFTEDTTFYYVCEPHISMNMRGIITVGTGVDAAAPSSETDETSESTPGFLLAGSIIAMLGAVVLLTRKNQ